MAVGVGVVALPDLAVVGLGERERGTLEHNQSNESNPHPTHLQQPSPEQSCRVHPIRVGSRGLLKLQYAVRVDINMP